MIEVELPDGAIAEFPDGTSPDVIKNALRKKFSPPQTVAGGKTDRERSWAETGMDALKSAGTGFVQGAVGLATLPQDLGTMLGEKATGLIDRAMGVAPEEIAARRQAVAQNATPLQAPSGQQLMQTVQSVTGPLHQPETTAGQYAKTIGEFAPSAIAGPGSLMRKAALATVPAVASEAAGQATEGTAAEPYARFAAALAGGVAAAAPGVKAGTKQMLKNAPSYAKVKAQADTIYSKLRVADVKYDANGIQTAINDVAKLKIDPVLDPKAARLRDVFVQNAGKSLDFEEMDNLKQIATSILRDQSVANRDKFFVRSILKKFEDVTDRGSFVTNGTIPANQVVALTKKAKELARSKILADGIQKMQNKSEWYAAGPESGLRNQFGSYGKREGVNLTDVEKKAFQKVVKREGVLNPLHNAGSRIGQMAIGGTTLGATGSITASIASIIGSAAARKFMEVYTMKGVNDAMKTVLAGKSAQQKAAVLDALRMGQAKAQVLLTTDAGRRSAQEPFLTDARGNSYPFPIGAGTSQ